MTLPLELRMAASELEKNRLLARTRDVSFRGLYFLGNEEYMPGAPIEFVLTLPKEITQAGDVHIRCYGQIVRVEPNGDARGVAARIERYEFLPAV
jgi:hypothetical protein